ncbi:30S ribosomal protein S27ae [Candidatus Marsarchaeota G2 archaeon ECH_B_SAG-F08]|jgi:SSU ribosomal protein S27AE|uniref:Small ribosomal subunit protein eS31 n=6 Tax=Candidatus Marsarchaeota TaxID=1978152 RepID=A0A2R6AK32_9ARCH|nr:MAG: 30S ribosomal protein S27ae [Candidatus Marsarchaeota G1 archaeon BE_D]PSN89719.1 MAG: 30S ribosomal protein S27ae [Candidatus Marsarchaeota G1 archaeon OSP_C]PSN92700.1 MAG: 30S ribosomal protein S27ae [Candidatus Marsarchaeota G1 archaeon OSP_B]PSN97894.1 MAG: 30S ribosomal protein S27ae [Candidatus Marsarchaeota G2 archaeon ECH_B_SAG-F08]PSO02926.1 MAG: 30S ribosomal protein S27ae [Candidatus Marsarchaeota G2 archaeon ECH_B_SAG-E12]PSO03816.1 MAG: 30S ribosomal protein S27ae [Candid
MPYVHKIYEYDYQKMLIKPKNKKCPRCGSYLAHHKAGVERLACGKCGYTEYLKTKSK